MNNSDDKHTGLTRVHSSSLIIRAPQRWVGLVAVGYTKCPDVSTYVDPTQLYTKAYSLTYIDELNLLLFHKLERFPEIDDLVKI